MQNEADNFAECAVRIGRNWQLEIQTWQRKFNYIARACTSTGATLFLARLGRACRRTTKRKRRKARTTNEENQPTLRRGEKTGYDDPFSFTRDTMETNGPIETGKLTDLVRSFLLRSGPRTFDRVFKWVPNPDICIWRFTPCFA